MMDPKHIEAVARALEPRCFARMDEGWPRSHMNAFEARTEASDRRRIARARKNAATAIEAYESAKAAQQWRPIETAPRDRTILVFGLPENLVMDGVALVTYNNPAIYTAAWDELDEAFCLSGGSWLGPFIEPTHWMPLPARPSAAQQPAMLTIPEIETKGRREL